MTHVQTGTILDAILARTAADLADRKSITAVADLEAAARFSAGAAQSASRPRWSRHVGHCRDQARLAVTRGVSGQRRPGDGGK